jgi:hypothetical protein
LLCQFRRQALGGKNNQAMEFASTARIDLVDGPG